MAIKLRLGEKEILEKAVKSAAMNREYYRKHMEERAPLPRYEESDLGLLEGGVGDSRLPLVLRKLEEEAGVQESLSLTETVSKAKAAENGLVNGENVIPNGTKESSGSTGEAKERLWDALIGIQFSRSCGQPTTLPCSLLTFFFSQRGEYVFAALYKSDF